MAGKDSRELFEKLKDRYDKVDEQFLEFTLRTPVGREHKEVLGSFIHETRGSAGRVGRALLKGDLPESSSPDKRWRYYNALLTNMGIMELILKMAEVTDAIPNG